MSVCVCVCLCVGGRVKLSILFPKFSIFPQIFSKISQNFKEGGGGSLVYQWFVVTKLSSLKMQRNPTIIVNGSLILSGAVDSSRVQSKNSAKKVLLVGCDYVKICYINFHILFSENHLDQMPAKKCVGQLNFEPCSVLES